MLTPIKRKWKFHTEQTSEQEIVLEIIRKESVVQEDIKILNMCAPNNSTKICELTQHWKEKQMNQLLYLGISVPLYQSWTDAAG